MGYESRFYLTLAPADSTHLTNDYLKDEDGALLKDEKGELVPGPQGLYCQKVAMVDISKAGYEGPVAALVAESIKAQKARIANGASPWGIYTGGDDFAVEDPYGDPLAPVDLDALIAALEAELAEGEQYRRFVLLLGTAKVWRDTLDSFGGPRMIRVLHYGY